MVEPDAFHGNWQEIQDKLRQRWCQLTNNNGQSFDESLGYLVDLMQRKSDDARHAIERYLDELAAKTASTLEDSTKTIATYAQQSTARFEEGTQRAVDEVRKTYRETRRYVRRHPAEAMAICFGIGMVAGWLIGSMTRPNNNDG